MLAHFHEGRNGGLMGEAGQVGSSSTIPAYSMDGMTTDEGGEDGQVTVGKKRMGDG